MNKLALCNRGEKCDHCIPSEEPEMLCAYPFTIEDFPTSQLFNVIDDLFEEDCPKIKENVSDGGGQ